MLRRVHSRTFFARLTRAPAYHCTRICFLSCRLFFARFGDMASCCPSFKAGLLLGCGAKHATPVFALHDAAAVFVRASAPRRHWYVRWVLTVAWSADRLAAFSQLASQFTDPGNGFQFTGLTDPVHSVTYGFVFPPLATSGAQSTEFIGEIVAPLAAKWVGVALGGAMNGDLLLMAWPNGNDIVFSTRFSTYVLKSDGTIADANNISDHTPCHRTYFRCKCYSRVLIVSPRPYTGDAVLTTLPSSSVNSTHWKWVFRCQGCTRELLACSNSMEYLRKHRMEQWCFQRWHRCHEPRRPGLGNVQRCRRYSRRPQLYLQRTHRLYAHMSSLSVL